MKIIKTGLLLRHKFTCKNCGTIFEAEGDEYQKETWNNMNHHVAEYQATCPVCNKEVLDIAVRTIIINNYTFSKEPYD